LHRAKENFGRGGIVKVHHLKAELALSLVVVVWSRLEDAKSSYARKKTCPGELFVREQEFCCFKESQTMFLVV
jgi:hypothetical protein